MITDPPSAIEIGVDTHGTFTDTLRRVPGAPIRTLKVQARVTHLRGG